VRRVVALVTPILALCLAAGLLLRSRGVGALSPEAAVETAGGERAALAVSEASPGAAPAPVAGARGSPVPDTTVVKGHVRDPAGAPVPDVTVTVYRAEEGTEMPSDAPGAGRTVFGPPPAGAPRSPTWRSRHAAVTGADGAYAVPGVPASGWAEVVARRHDRFVESARVALGPDRLVDFVLVEEPRVSVRLFAADGSAVSGVRFDAFVRRAYADGEVAPFGWTVVQDDGRERAAALEVVRSRAGGPSWATLRVSGRTGADGTLACALPQYGAYRIAAFVPGHRALVIEGLAAAGDAPRDFGDVALRAEPDAGRARLVGPDGAPLRAHAVVLTTADDFQVPLVGPAPGGARRTDADGWFSLEHVVEDEPYHVWLDPEARLRSLPLRFVARLRRDGEVRVPDR
jgi:hypothetical protein